MRTPSPKIRVSCLHCGTEMLVTQSRLDDGRGKFCSRQCQNAHAVRKYLAVCEKCGKKFYTVPSMHQRFCSRKCAGIEGKPKIEFKCEICGKIFEVTESQTRHNVVRFCSRSCQHEAKRRVTGTEHPLWTRIEKECEWCGKKVWVKPAKLAEFRFCSKQCHGAYTAAKMAELNGPTSIERLLMEELDRRGIEYSTQHKIAVWLIDITLPRHRIAIEADGNYWHSSDAQQQKDANKNHWLIAHGWAVFRFTETEIHASASACIDRVVTFISSQALQG